MYERISWFVENKNAVANINISSRGNLSKEKLLNFIHSNSKKFKIEHSRINDVKISLGQVLKYNDDKHKKYISYICPIFYSYNGKYLGYGLKYVPGNIGYLKEFSELIIYSKTNKK